MLAVASGRVHSAHMQDVDERLRQNRVLQVATRVNAAEAQLIQDAIDLTDLGTSKWIRNALIKRARAEVALTRAKKK